MSDPPPSYKKVVDSPPTYNEAVAAKNQMVFPLIEEEDPIPIPMGTDILAIRTSLLEEVSPGNDDLHSKINNDEVLRFLVSKKDVSSFWKNLFG